MSTIFQTKEQVVTDTPLLLFDCQLWGGQLEHWSTHQVTVGGVTYAARVLRHNVFEIQTSSDQGVDAIPKISLGLANADSHFSQLERGGGFKGALLTVRFLFFDLRQGLPSSDISTVFLGIMNPPDQVTQSTFQLSAINRMNLQRVLLPEVRVQRRCPWDFPTTPAQRLEAATGGTDGKYSRLYRCGYSPDIAGGAGNLDGSAAFASCSFTRADCTARGMFSQDSALRATARFGGIEFVPSVVQVRSYGEKGTHLSPVSPNEARYNDFVPIVYGTAWYAPTIVFTRNDGNLTRMEVLLGLGEIQSVVTVLVNQIEIPLGVAGSNMTGTGWFNLIGTGTRNGGFNPDFTDATGNPLGDPYGSMAFLSVVVPNQINDGLSLPSIKVLLQGVKLAQYGIDGSFLGEQFTSNPAWITLDILRRSGWSLDEVDLPTFAQAASYCSQTIQAQDLNGNAISIPRFDCNLVLNYRRTAGDLIRAIRNAARLYLTYGNDGLLQLRVENTLALQQPSQLAWSNSVSQLNGGWPSYEFGDGSTGVSGILRKPNGDPSIRLWSRSTTDTPNRFAIEFQDSLNEYQQDSFSLVDVGDVDRAGQEITAPLTVLGIPNYDQAARILKFNLDKSIYGNTYVEFETSVKAIGIQPGDLISLTYLKEGFTRQPFRVVKIAPSTNYRTSLLTAQIHDDAWYDDTNGQVSGDSGARRQPGTGVGLPQPLIGNIVDTNGDIQFGVVETSSAASDGSLILNATVGFTPPPAPQTGGPAIPFLNLAATTAATGGTLTGGQTWYYAITAVDGNGLESSLSFVVRATTAAETNTNIVTLSSLSFSSSSAGFNVYRGANPAQLFRVAQNQTLAVQFTDTGLARQVACPPDANYDHANFYWRLELQPEYSATLYSATTLGNSTLEMIANAYVGMTVRITRGRGAGQERPISSNTVTTLNLTTAPWSIEPDTTSFFTVAEAGWHFGASGKTSPVQFQIPNRTGATIHVSGRAANANDAEAPLDLATVTRWLIGGAGDAAVDQDVPPLPAFGIGLSTHSGGTVELSGVSFPQLTNTRTITAGTLALYYWDELSGPTALKLVSAISASDTAIDLTHAGAAQAGSFIQLEGEVALVIAVSSGSTHYQLTRGVQGSAAAAHAAQTAVYELQQKVQIVPFVRDFFGSPASGSWSYPVLLPDCRIASSELFVTNARGNSATAAICLTQTTDFGLRTLSGGQYSFQLEGFLAVETGATPDLGIEATHAARDIYAIVRAAPVGAAIQLQLNQNGTPYCTVTIADGATQSTSVGGFGLPVLSIGARMSLDIVSVGVTTPGADLTVVIRL